MLAAFNNYPAVVLRLLRAGADANLRSVSGDTALGFAKKQGHSECARALEGALCLPEI